MFDFDYLIAVLVFLMITWINFSKKQVLKDTNRRIFLYYLGIGVCDIILDMISSYIIGLHDPDLNQSGTIVTTLLYILQALLPYCMLIYGLSLRNIPREKIIKEIILLSIFPILMMGSVILNVFYGFYFSFDAFGYYIHGPAYIAMYIYATCLTMCLGMLIFVFRDDFMPEKRKVLWQLLFIEASCVVLQAIHTDILLTGFGIGLGLVVLMQTINNPLSKIDNLTGKLDQGSMYATIEELLSKGVSFHILSLNISQLRQINTIFGTKAGDRYILQLMEKIDQFIHVPVFRMAGKRFAAIFVDHEEYAIAKSKVKHIMTSNTEPSIIPFPVEVCTISFANELENVDAIIGYMDFLSAKVENKKGQKLMESNEATLKAYMYQNEVEKFLPEAIEKNYFQVFYHPIYDVQQQKYVAVEALSRLYHPELGYISPDIFIDIAQKNGQIREIDDLQFENICRFFDKNRFLLKCMDNVKVNVSPLDIIHSGFGERRLNRIHQYQLPPSFFQFEITETLATVYSDAVIKDIEILEKEGIRFCMDDFGSGYANLNSVIQIPFVAIKMDRSLLFGILEDKRKAQLYKGTVEQFKYLDLKIISEGVETKEEYELLKSWGVDMVQGYYFSRPLDEMDLIKTMKKNMN